MNAVDRRRKEEYNKYKASIRPGDLVNIGRESMYTIKEFVFWRYARSPHHCLTLAYGKNFGIILETTQENVFKALYKDGTIIYLYTYDLCRGIIGRSLSQ